MKLALFFGPFVTAVEEDLTECQQQQWQNSGDRLFPMTFSPECDEDGHYSQIQCMPLTNQCWCSTKDGRFIPGTTVFHKFDLNNPDPRNSPDLRCPSEEEYTNCQKRALYAESIGSAVITPEFRSDCDNEGYCLQRQTDFFGRSWCTEKNTKDCGFPDAQGHGPIPGTLTEYGEPLKKCPGDEILRGVAPLNYAEARIFCESSGMYLPQPTDVKRNQELKAYGPSWIDILPEITTQSGSYGHWAERQRTYLMEDGSWQVSLASDSKEFYCVERKPMKCIEAFRAIDKGALETALSNGLWQVSYPEEKKYKRAGYGDLLDIDNISLRTRFRYECYVPEVIASFMCVRIHTEEEYLVECETPKCKKFKRQPIKLEDYEYFNCYGINK